MKEQKKLSIKDILTHEKRYYVQGVDELNQFIETPASREITDTKRFYITTIISVVAAIGAVAAAIFSLLQLLR